MRRPGLAHGAQGDPVGDLHPERHLDVHGQCSGPWRALATGAGAAGVGSSVFGSSKKNSVGSKPFLAHRSVTSRVIAVPVLLRILQRQVVPILLKGLWKVGDLPGKIP